MRSSLQHCPNVIAESSEIKKSGNSILHLGLPLIVESQSQPRYQPALFTAESAMDERARLKNDGGLSIRRCLATCRRAQCCFT